jgi:transcriptional regulator of aroF, aroG, tyrA and aromatic amino acid transport
MRIKFHCGNRPGLLRDLLDLLGEEGVVISRTEWAGDSNERLYFECPSLGLEAFELLCPRLQAIEGVLAVASTRLTPSERQRAELDTLLGALRDPRVLHGFDSIFHSSRALSAAVEHARRMATVDAPLLIEGEPGTGKKLLARACHTLSARAHAPFMVLNCAGLAEPLIDTELFGYGPGAFEGARSDGRLGLLELAAGGSLLIDGVGALSPRLQGKLLRYLQEGSFCRVGSDQPIALDVRIICATQIDLAGSAQLGEFSAELYQRLSVLTLKIPPLRECFDGLAELERHFLGQASRQIGCPLPILLPSAQDKLRLYHWPGNVRQLEDVLYQAVALSEGRLIRAEHLRLADFGEQPPLGEFSLEGDLGAIVGRFEKAVLERLYRDFGTSRSLGKRLGVSHTTIANKLRAYGVSEGH